MLACLMPSNRAQRLSIFGEIAIGRLTSRLTALHPEMQDRRQTAFPCIA